MENGPVNGIVRGLDPDADSLLEKARAAYSRGRWLCAGILRLGETLDA